MSTPVLDLIHKARLAYLTMRGAEVAGVESSEFDPLVEAFDAAVREMASAPVSSLEEVRAKARFLVWIGQDEQGNQLADTSFLDRFLAELAGKEFTAADEAKFWENAA